MEKWDERFIERARAISYWSKDPSTKSGAVIVRDRVVVSEGYNGFPQKIRDDDRYLDRTLKYDMIVHCEINALVFALKSGTSIEGCTLYTFPFHCCSRCTSIMIQAGITRVVAPKLEERHRDRWAKNLTLARSMYEEAGVEVVDA